MSSWGAKVEARVAAYLAPFGNVSGTTCLERIVEKPIMEGCRKFLSL